MEVSRRSQRTKDGEETKAKVTKSCGKQSKEKPALSPIEEETDSPDSSEDSAINLQGIEPEALAKNYEYDLRVSLREDYEEALRDLEDEEDEEVEGKQRAESPPFLTARNGSDHEAGSKLSDSNSTTSYERSTLDDDDDEDEDDSSFPGESTSGDIDYRNNNDYEVDDLEGDLDKDNESGSLLESSKKMKENGSKTAPGALTIKSLDSNREGRLHELTTTVDWLKARLAKSERDIYCLKKRLSLEKSRNRKFVQRYEEDRNVTKESLRIDLELWIKKLNDGLKDYLAEWQQRERLRLNEEISRISDLYSQEIAKSLKNSLKEWQTEDSKKIFEIFDKRERSRQDNERANANAVYEKIQNHLENLEKRNRKSYSSFRKQIDKWEERLREEVVKLREEDLKKLRQHVIDMWHEEERKKHPEPSVKREKSKERCMEKQACSFPGAEALLRVEENLLKRLRDSSSKDLRRTEQIVRTELKAQRRELAKRMNEKIAELWMAFEEFGFAPGVGVDRARLKRLSSGVSTVAGRNDLEDCRGLAGSFMKDTMLNPDVFGNRWIGGKILTRAPRADDSTRSNTDIEDGDRDYREDDDDDENILEEASEKSNQQSPRIPSTLLDIETTKNSTKPNETTEDTCDAADGLSCQTLTKK